MLKLLSLILAITPIPVNELILLFEKEKENTQMAVGFEAATDHPFCLGEVYPDWSSYTVDTVGTKRNKVIEYRFPARTEITKRTVHHDYPKPVTSPQVYEHGLPIKTDLVFRYSKDKLEYIGLRCTIFKSPGDTLNYVNGLIVDVNPFSSRMLTFRRCEGGRVIQEYTNLDSDTNNPNYSSYFERNVGLSYSTRIDAGVPRGYLPLPPGVTERKVSDWTKIFKEVYSYHYFIKVDYYCR